MTEKDFKIVIQWRNILGGVLIGIAAMAFFGLMINVWGLLLPAPTKVAVGLGTMSVGGALLIK